MSFPYILHMSAYVDFGDLKVWTRIRLAISSQDMRGRKIVMNMERYLTRNDEIDSSKQIVCAR